MDRMSEIGELLDLKKAIWYCGFDKLNLRSLEPLRYEVQYRIDKLIAESKSVNYEAVNPLGWNKSNHGVKEENI